MPSASRKTHLRFAAFIPCDAVDALGVFDGDGRDFGFDAAARSSRMLIDVTVDPDANDVVTKRVFPTHEFSASSVTSHDGWCAKLKPGAEPSKTGLANDDRLFATVTEDVREEGEFSVTRVRLEAHGKNPLVFFAPNADAVVDLEIFYRREGTQKIPALIQFDGRHDAFPSWELYIDRVAAFQHDTYGEGGSPMTGLWNELPMAGQCDRTDSSWSCR